ncbi:glycosyltransferase family 2 protein [Demequina sediminicola]|uniref:glycosyltransferase family 2 protein n=1 Tax=Demequina sediminicola TaxID=1095026 RepID=UPI00078484B6|nr:glycosyltransferase family 2 protein [Demequina sediminicola]
MSITADLEVLIACHNRKELTVRAVERVRATAPVRTHITVVDDGSTDGTADALASIAGPDLTVLTGDGSLFWAASMAWAEKTVLYRRSDRDFSLVWLNDDVRLDADALSRLVSVSAENPHSIVIGPMRDPDSSELTYGGFATAGIHPLRFDLIPWSSHQQHADTLNGNLVLIPATAADRIGPIDGEFAHALADIDYGLRARRLGIHVVVAPGTLGTCARNPAPPREPLLTAWRRFLSPKGGGNPASAARVLKKDRPGTWPLWWASTYVTWWLREPTSRIRRRGGQR